MSDRDDLSDRIDEMHAAPKARESMPLAEPIGKDVAGWTLFAIPPIGGIAVGLLNHTLVGPIRCSFRSVVRG